ncbi:hypothetical protein PS2_003741 [Malus domestica]
MGTSMKPAIFEAFDTARSIARWHQAVKRSRALRKAAISDESFDTARSIARWHQAVKRRRALRKAASSIEFRQDDADQASIVVRWFEVKNHESSLNNGTDVRN